MAEDRFYVYRLFDDPLVTLYVGKGSGRRLASQKSKYRCNGEVIRRFKRERDAFVFEIEMIALLKPQLNKHPGGNGNNAKRAKRRQKWEIEIEHVGTRRYAARALLNFDLRPYIDASKIEAIRQVANGPRV